MQHPWWIPVRDLAKHVLVCSMCLVLFVVGAILESEINAIAERLISSKFTFHVLLCLEYAIVIGDAALIFALLVGTAWYSLKRVLR